MEQPSLSHRYQATAFAELDEIIRDQKVWGFFKKSISDGYAANAGDHIIAMNKLLDRAFDYVETSIKNGAKSGEIFKGLNEDIFRSGDKNFWFTKLYSNFKRNVKPNGVLNLYGGHLHGPRVLNIGCGDGIYSRILFDRGYKVTMADVIDFRDPSARDLPFQLMTQADLPFPDLFADTTLVMSVLHHVDPGEVIPLLQEVRRVSQRVIVEEESYGIKENLNEFKQQIESDPRLREFIEMPVADQIKYMKLLDYFSNVVIMNISGMNFPFGYRTINEWRKIFASVDFEVEKTILIGFGRFHRTGRVAFILKRI